MDQIIQHEAWQRDDYMAFVGRNYMRNGFGALPAVAISGDVYAEVNQGRWIVQCPAAGCGGAMVVTTTTPIYMCVDCANAGNGGQWYQVVFPDAVELVAIERELLKRPARMPAQAVNRNWKPGETVDDLIAENTARGIS